MIPCNRIAPSRERANDVAPETCPTKLGPQVSYMSSYERPGTVDLRLTPYLIEKLMGGGSDTVAPQEVRQDP